MAYHRRPKRRRPGRRRSPKRHYPKRGRRIKKVIVSRGGYRL